MIYRKITQRMPQFLDYNQFINEGEESLDPKNEEINEDTVEGYEYHFNFEGKKYHIRQGKKDESIFGIKTKDGKWFCLTKGNLFNPEDKKMDLNEFIKFLQRGIKYFNVRNPVELEDVKNSEWSQYFDYEIKHRPGRITKKYVVLKMHCGKASAKWHARKK